MIGRQLIGGVILLLSVVVASLACSAPPPQSPDSPEAQATNVHRTAIAQVQAIIANKSTPTPPPAATATPTPTCPNAIWWTEARTHTGETRTIQGTVIETRPAPGGGTLIEVGEPYPDPNGMLVEVPGSGPGEWNGQMVCANGKIFSQEGEAIMQLSDRLALQVLGPG